jgi:hypothetical protein
MTTPRSRPDARTASSSPPKEPLRDILWFCGTSVTSVRGMDVLLSDTSFQATGHPPRVSCRGPPVTDLTVAITLSEAASGVSRCARSPGPTDQLPKQRDQTVLSF